MLSESESNTSCEIILPPRNRRRRVLLSSEDDTSLENVHIDNNIAGDQEWFDPRGNQPNITDFTSVYDVDANNIELQNCVSVEDFYALLVTEEMLDKISEQTNIYAMQKRLTITSKRIDRWVHTNKEEIKRFLGLIIWMGLVKLPSLNLYWSMDPM